MDRISKSGERFLTFVGKNELYEAGIAFVSRETDLLAYPRIEIFFDSDAENRVILQLHRALNIQSHRSGKHLIRVFS